MWIYDWWVTMRVTIVLLALAIPLGVVGVIMLPGDSPFMAIGGLYSALAMGIGFFADDYRLRRRRRVR